MHYIRQYIREGIDFIFQIFLNRFLILTLSLRDFSKIYINNFFGFLWAILDPLAFVLIMYVVFGARYSDKDPGAIPFFVYLITGYIAYDLFSSALFAVTTSIKEHAFLLKKVSFRVAILPIVALLSKLMMHGIVLALCIIVLLFNRIYPSLFWFQLFYYIFALSVLMVALGWLTSSIYLFFPDIRNVVNIVIRILLFVSPIFWSMDGLPPSYQFVLKFNPAYYIVNGYRESLIFDIGFWSHPRVTVYFWGVCLVTLVTGISVFKKLRPHFADVVD